MISEMGPPDFRPLEDWGHDAMWLDGLHHALHVALTGERDGYYADFDGSIGQIAAELRRPEGPRLVACAQNHDQIGNRALGDRLPDAKRRLAAAVVLFSPADTAALPGRGVGETAPFRFFTDHVDPFFAEATREGRRASSRASPASRARCPTRRRRRASSSRGSRPASRRSSTSACSACGASSRASSRQPSTRRRGRSSSAAAAQPSGRLRQRDRGARRVSSLTFLGPGA